MHLNHRRAYVHHAMSIQWPVWSQQIEQMYYRFQSQASVNYPRLKAMASGCGSSW